LRKEVLQTANGVVIDFRGDIPNGWFAMMWGGYKIGVYRSGHGWPIWMSIAPTYDLAIEEAKKLRDEARLPKNSIQATGKLLNFLNVKIGPPLMSSKANDLRIPLVALVLIVGIGSWFIRGFFM
jgi:hypothetical protein